MKRGPAHAGKLPSWERTAFALVFALMAAFVVAVTISAARSGSRAATGRAGNLAGRAASPAARQAGPEEAASRPRAAAGRRRSAAVSARSETAAGSQALLDRQLAAALRPVLAHERGHIAVGVIDVSTGARAVYNGTRRFHTGGIEKAGILAALLLDHQQEGSRLTSQEAALTGPMIEDGDNKAAAELYAMVDRNKGLAAANAQLQLAHTVFGPPGRWGLSSTTVIDQLQLLIDLTATRSPLAAASRDYELGLMGNVQPSQTWGVPAAASPGTSYAVKTGWLKDPVRWVTNSIGVVDHRGHQLLIVVLADGQPSKAAGVSADSAAAFAAAAVVTGGP